MSYDRDIRIARRILRGLAVGNLIALGVNLRAHNWTVAITCGVWLCNLCYYVCLLKTQQETRDEMRLIEAGLSAMRNEIETGEY